MSIANEIQRLQAAKANIKTAIENKGVTVGDGTIDTYAEKINEISDGSGDYDQGYEDGKNSVVDYMKYAQGIKFKNLNLFGASEVNLNFEELSDLTEMFWANASDNQWSQNTTLEHITISTKAKVKNMYRIFANSNTSLADTTLKHITFNFEMDIENANSVNMNNGFQNAKGIEVIDGTPLNVSNTNTFNSTFTQCVALREIRFVEGSIKSNIGFSQSDKLSTDTIQSIIDGLADLSGEEQYILVGAQNSTDTYAYPEEEVVIEDIINVDLYIDYTMDDGAPVYRVIYGSKLEEAYTYKKTSGGTPQTLTVHKTVGEKLTDEQKATITAKNWTLVY